MKKNFKNNFLIRYCHKFLFFISLLIKFPFLKHDKELSLYRKKHKGQRCFIVATGPSLKIEDLKMLKGEICFSMNSIIKSFDKTDWRPTYYTITDPGVFESYKDLVKEKYFQKIFYRKGLDDKNKNVCHFSLNIIKYRFCLNSKNFKNKLFPSKNIKRYFNDGPSVVFSIIQLAIYMGFSEIYLLGQDCNYEGNLHSNIASVDYKFKPTNVQALSMIDCFENYSSVLDKYSLKIFNATRGGRLEVFPRVNLEDIIQPKENSL